MTDSKCHFDDAVPVHIRRDDRPTARASLRLTLASEGPSGAGKVVLRLTDPSDYLFLFVLVVGEGEYSAVRKNNSLRVDFGTFPGELVKLVHLCIEEARKESPNFYLDLLLQHAMGCLSVVRSDSFSENRVISLDLQRPGDEEQKRYLAERAKGLEEALKLSHRREATLEAELRDCRVADARGRQSHSDEVSDLRCRLAEAEAARRADAAEAAQRHQEALALQRADAERRFEAQVRSLTEKNTEVGAKAAELSEARVRLEAQLREATRSLEQLGEAHRAAQLERDRARDEAERSVTRHAEAAAQLETARAAVIRLEEKVRGLEALNSTLTVTLKGKAHLEAALEDAKAREAELRGLLADVERRGHSTADYAQQLSEKLQKYVQKWQRASADIKALEQQREDADLQTRRVQIETQRLSELLHVKEGALLEKEEHVRKLQSDLAAVQDKLTASEKANQWMSNRLNSASAAPPPLSHLSSRLGPVPAYSPANPSPLLPSPLLGSYQGLSSTGVASDSPANPSYLLSAQPRPTFAPNPPALMRSLGDENGASALVARPLSTHPKPPPSSAPTSLASYLSAGRPTSPPEGPSSFFASPHAL